MALDVPILALHSSIAAWTPARTDARFSPACERATSLRGRVMSEARKRGRLPNGKSPGPLRTGAFFVASRLTRTAARS